MDTFEGDRIVQYKIGVLAEMFGISPQTIRFYESHGFLQPKREESSTTRRYYPRNIKWLFNIRRYLAMGFSIKQINGLFACEEVDAMQAMMEKQIRELEEKIKTAQSQLDAVCRQKKDIEHVNRYLNVCEELDSFEMDVIMNQHGQVIDDSPACIALICNWLQHIEYVYSATILTKEYMKGETQERDSGICIEPEFFFAFALSDNAMVRHIHYDKVVHTVITLSDGIMDLENVKQYCLDHQLEIVGDTIGRCVVRTGEKECNQEQIRPKCVYYEIFVPVQ